MKALVTQFDDKRLSNAVATPTCSSCCCCCCCLATTIASSSLLAQRISKEGKKLQIPDRKLLTLLAALFAPVTAALVYFGFWSINSLLRTCSDQSFVFSGTVINEPYTTCTNPGSAFIFPLVAIVPFLVIFYLYKRVHIEKPLKRSLLVTSLIATSFAIEAAIGASLIFSGVGIIFYIIMIPVVIGWISIWYHRHIGKEVSKELLNTSTPQTEHTQLPSQDQKIDKHEESTNTEEPSQQNPTNTSTQQ
jgi:hypothetical protein